MTHNTYNLLLKENPEKALRYLQSQEELSRDNSRTPMQWTAGPNAGFTTGTPWLTINSNYQTVNVEAAEKDSTSILHFVRALTRLRNQHKDVLVYGKYTLVDKDNPYVYAYTREMGDKKFLILLNFTSKQATTSTRVDMSKAKLLLGNYPMPSMNGELRPYEAVIMEL